MISIFDVKPHVVSRDLSGKSFLFYGEKKSGKTSNACKFPKHILLGFEKGWNFIDGAMGIPITSWRDALNVKKELLRDSKEVEEGKKKETAYKTVIVDTVDIAYDMCERFILDKEAAEYLDETENKRGYRAVSLEYDKFFQDIVRAGYTLVCISHSTSKQVKEAGEKYDKTIPTIQGRGLLVLSRLVDVMAYSAYETDENGKTSSVLILRGNKFLEAGSRNGYLPEKIPFTYESLEEAMNNSLDEMTKAGINVVDKGENLFKKSTDIYEGHSFDDIINKIKEYASALMQQGRRAEYDKIADEYLGRGRFVKDASPAQLDVILMILDDLEDLPDTGVTPWKLGAPGNRAEVKAQARALEKEEVEKGEPVEKRTRTRKKTTMVTPKKVEDDDDDDLAFLDDEDD